MRAALAVVAALVVVGLVAAVLVGGPWFAPRPIAATHTIDQRALAQLEARPINIPTFRSRDDCITGPVYPKAGGGFGSGPVYAQGGPSSSTTWGNYFHVFAFADAKVAGPVLVRAIHLFDATPVVFVGPNATGGVLGTDTVDGKSVQQRTEAVIDTSLAPKDPGPPWGMTDLGVTHPYQWPLIAGEQRAVLSGSGWQIDGPGFAETFAVC